MATPFSFKSIMRQLRESFPGRIVSYVHHDTPDDVENGYMVLVPGGLEAEPTEEITRVSALHRRYFSVQLACISTEADELLEELICKTHEALTGFAVPEVGGARVEYDRGEVIEIDGFAVYWAETFYVEYYRVN